MNIQPEGFDYRRDTTVPILLSLSVAVLLGVVWFGSMFVIVTYGQF